MIDDLILFIDRFRVEGQADITRVTELHTKLATKLPTEQGGGGYKKKSRKYKRRKNKSKRKKRTKGKRSKRR
jgi:hypothetical protein